MKQDAIVIGGGLVGITISVSLAKRGVKVLLLDSGEAGKGASWGNAGHLATEQVYPVADIKILRKLPAMLMDPLGALRVDWRYLPEFTRWGWSVLKNMTPKSTERIHRALMSINSLCMESWERFCKTWSLQQWVRFEGSLLCAEKQDTAAQLHQKGALLNALGIENHEYDSEALREFEPALSGKVRRAIFFPKTGHVTNIDAVISTLLRSLVGMNSNIIENCRVTDVLPLGDEGYLVKTLRGSYCTKKIILSAGAFSRPLAKQMTGIDVPLDTERGYHLCLPHEKYRISIPVSSMDRHFIMTPMESGLRLAGTVEYAGLVQPPNMERARNLLPLAQPMFAHPLNSCDASEWMGFRPTTCDSLPVIDRIDNMLFAFGHQHLGITQATVTAEAIEKLFFDEVVPINIKQFSINRSSKK
ncbi:MAG: FAD-dependent oxidoreductase [Lautropia sp.]|nr:FAD-dependent oxidoreductase [Lautropia sp.]